MILVTGGAGFIGSHVVDALLERGEQVVCIDDLNDYYDARKKRATVERHRKHPNYVFSKVDIRDRAALERVFENHDITTIIHLAARAGVRASIEDAELYYQTNVIGTLHLLELAREHAVLNVVVASSSSVYGNSKEQRFHEDLKLDDQISPYASSKKAVENLCSTYATLYSIPVTCLRFFTVYGPRGRPDMAPYFFMESILNGKQIPVFGDGTTSRDYTFVGDIVQGIIAAHDRPRPFGVYNLGNNEPVTLNEFIATIETVVGKKAKRLTRELQPGDVDRTWADISHAQKDLDYRPTTSLKQGLKAQFEWYKRTDGGLRSERERPLTIRSVPKVAERYEDAYLNEHHFSAGKNWIGFAKRVRESNIKEAERVIAESFGGKEQVKGKRFIDLGCGSGLFSLAAFRLGAKEVVSVDVDQFSIRSTIQLRDRFGDRKRWKVVRGSALDREFLKELGAFDIIYSWSVLHHTGDLTSALKNLDVIAKPSSKLYLAIYNKSNGHILEGTSAFWLKAKALYNRVGPLRKKAMYATYATYLLTGITLSGRNPVRYVRKYENFRGTNFWTEVRNWLGSYPYEFASVDEITTTMNKNGWTAVTTKPARALGCNEFLFEKK